MLRGAEAASDASGHAILLNVVRTPFTGQGFGSLGFEYARQPMPNGTLVWSGRAHSVDYAIGANSYTFARELPGSRQLTDVDGSSTGTRQDVSPRDYGQYALNGEAASELGGGRLRFTGKASYSRYHEDSAVASYDAGAALTGADFNPYTETKRGGEFGGQFDHGVGDWMLSSTLLLTRARFESEITSTHSDAAGTVGSVFEQRQLRDSGESILRATLAREISAARRLEFGLEAALNTLDAESRAHAGSRRRRISDSGAEFQRAHRGAARRRIRELRLASRARLVARLCGSRASSRGSNSAAIPTRWWSSLSPSRRCNCRARSEPQTSCDCDWRATSASWISTTSFRRCRSPTSASKAAIRTCGRKPTGRWNWAPTCVRERTSGSPSTPFIAG